MKKVETKPDTAVASHKPTMFESIRETFDSIAIAFILAFLFRTFEAEAFVIPTGSMALTLMGAHKELDCPECGYPYKVGSSSEHPEDGERASLVMSATCPNCRRTAFLPETNVVSAAGDRILVTKYPYEFGEPKRFDVAVFKNPGKANQNYIKRLVGLPNEEVMIFRGDIYARPAGAEKFRIQRKPADKIPSVMQMVYDNDYVLPKLIQQGWPQRWIDGGRDTGQPAKWTTSADYKSFQADGKAAGEAWLRYQHTVPTSDAWRKLAQGSVPPGTAKPQLITDFCEYNTGGTGGPHQMVSTPSLGLHWVSDLILECELKFGEVSPGASAPEAILELIEGGRAFQCRIDAATGNVTLRIDGIDKFRPTAKAAVAGAGPHKLRFANVDDHLIVWANGKELKFDGPTNFLATNVADASLDESTDLTRVPLDDETEVPILDADVPKPQDLRSPVGIAAKGVALEAKHLRIWRDVYYIATRRKPNVAVNGSRFHENVEVRSSTEYASDYSADVFTAFEQTALGVNFTDESKVNRFMSNVEANPDRFRQIRGVAFRLEADQFFMCGDNSPLSSDSRLWTSSEHYVKRELLIGKALFVYWPHGLGTVGGTSIDLPNLPLIGGSYFPNFTDMRLIR